MILPILAFGHPNLRKQSTEITSDYPDLKDLVLNMFETMYNSSGVGLAAPQINKQIRLFVVDASNYADDEPEVEGFKKVFINPYIKEFRGEEKAFNEGCLSIPDIHEDVIRKEEVLLSYVDENFIQHEEWFSGVPARIIQHEYDHLEGVLFVDKIHNLRKIMVKRKLQDITKGEIEHKYKMTFSPKKK